MEVAWESVGKVGGEGVKDGYQPKEHISTQPPNKGSNLLHPSEGAEGTNQLPPKLRQIEFRKVTVEVLAHYGMVYKINGFVVERDLDLSGQNFFRIYKEPKTESEFSMIKTSSVLGIYASEKGSDV